MAYKSENNEHQATTEVAVMKGVSGAVLDRQAKSEPSIWMTPLNYINNDLYHRGLKRFLDIVGGSILLILLFPIIGSAWLAVRLTSSGAALFPQERVGKNGKPIIVYKLRSMYIDHKTKFDMSEIEEKEAKGHVHKDDNDPRVTPIGRFIRKFSIDEMPQLWNVVRGDMSLVGPRPLVPHMLALFPDIKEERSCVRPGITGLWQVLARDDNTSVHGMINYDRDYVAKFTLAMDLWILFKTPLVTLRGNGAQ